MSFFSRIGVSSLVVSGGLLLHAAGSYAEQQFPATGSSYQPGDAYIDLNGETKKFIGYTGHDTDTLNNISSERELYYGDKGTAQQYAVINGRERGAVGHVVAREMPTPSDHASPSFEGPHAPLSPEAISRLGVQVLHPEPVTDATKVGKISAMKRMIQTSRLAKIFAE